MLENLPKMLLGISQKFPLLCLDSFLLCSIMLTVITAVSTTVYTTVLSMALITTYHLSDTRHNVLYSIHT